MKYAAGCTAKRIPASYAAAVRAGCISSDRRKFFYIGGHRCSPRRFGRTGGGRCDCGGFPIRKTKTARSELIEHNLRLVVYIAQKFDNTGVGVEDLISIGTIGLIKAINTFNPEKRSSLPRTRPGALRTRF